MIYCLAWLSAPAISNLHVCLLLPPPPPLIIYILWKPQNMLLSYLIISCILFLQSSLNGFSFESTRWVGEIFWCFVFWCAVSQFSSFWWLWYLSWHLFFNIFCSVLKLTGFIVFVHAGSLQGLHNLHGSYNVGNMRGTLSSRNSSMNSIPSPGVQQPNGSFPVKDLIQVTYMLLSLRCIWFQKFC